jgi:hypothetical protein
MRQLAVRDEDEAREQLSLGRVRLGPGGLVVEDRESQEALVSFLDARDQAMARSFSESLRVLLRARDREIAEIVWRAVAEHFASRGPAEPTRIEIVNAAEIGGQAKVMSVKRGTDGKISGAVVATVP